jgi:monomeric sarcosine oxidase
MRPTYDVVIVGAGGIGCAAAYHAARAGRRVLLLEQFTLGHTHGSSHGGSRIIRYTHDARAYADQMPATFDLWRQLEQESGADLLTMTGGLYLSTPGEPWLEAARAINAALGFPQRVLDAADLRRDYPQFRLPDHWYGVEQAHSGILHASRCVAVMAAQAVRHGATLREQTPVTAVTPHGDGVAVTLATGETIHAGCALVCAGPWAARFLDPLLTFPVPLRVTRQQVAYFPVHDPAAYARGRFPLFILTDTPHIYGFPIHERAGAIKIALEQTALTTDPDAPRAVDDALLAELRAVVGEHFVGVGTTPVAVEPCLYTETPNRDFVIDRHPEHPQIVIAAGFSGRGFKHTLAVGRLLVDLALSPAGDYTSPFWRDLYRLDRFAHPSSSTISTATISTATISTA